VTLSPSEGAGPTVDCLPEERLQELALDAAEPERRDAEHLDACPVCRARVEALRRDADLFHELREATRRPEGPPRVPGYRLEGELRRGGQGIVYRAVQTSTQRTVALKVLSSRATPSARERRRFEREVELGSLLAHPGIVTVFDSGVSEGTPWFAMELVEGETLDAWVRAERPALERRLEVFLELCAAVIHAHRSGVLHRDLKPANVLVDREGRARVLDFGTARPVRAPRATAAGEFLGTLAYAAPEALSGGVDPVDTRADVYSLGVVLYELVTGALPIATDGPLSEVVARILHAPIDAPGRHAPGIDRELVTVLETALAKDRERRYSSVEALARDVRHFLAHEPLEAHPRRAGYVLAKALRRHRRALGAAAVVLVGTTALLTALVRARWSAQRSEESAELVRAVFQDVLGAAAPGRMGGDAPLRDVLALAAGRIETALAHAPDAQAAVQLTIGDTYRRLLMPAEAEGHLRAALARYRALEPDGLETAHALSLLGEVLASQQSPEAIPVQEEALALRRARLEADDPRVAASERGLALALMAQLRDADIERARTLLDAALARQLRRLPEDDPEIAESRMARARLARWDGEAARAEALVEAARLAFERHAEAGEIDPRRIECLTELAAFLQEDGRYEDAERRLAEAEALTRALYGDERTSDLLRRHAEIARARGELESAEELTRRALAFELGRWASSRPEEADALHDAARALGDGGGDSRLAAFRWLRRFRGDGAFELAGWMTRVAELCSARGRPLEAEALLQEALEIRCRAWGEACPVRQGTLFALAELYADEGRLDEARAAVDECLATAARRGEEDQATRARALERRLREEAP